MTSSFGSRALRIAAAACAALAGACTPPAQAPVPSATLANALQTHPCVVGAKKLASLCGTFRVYEDRAAHAGRTIDIHFIVVKAKHPAHRAIFWNPGGPGAGATQFAGPLADGAGERFLTTLRDSYDLVFVDDRGSGLSNGLQCTLFSPKDPQSYFLQIWPDAALRACREQLAVRADLSLYATDYAVDDIDDLRAALGYPKIVLSGASGGTTLYLDYARRHPDHVESVVLEGVAPPGYLVIPLEDAQGAQLAVDHLAADCEADAACRARFPQFRAQFAAVVHRFDRGPIRVDVMDTATHELQSVLLSKEVFADRLRQNLYGNGSAAYVPYIIERAFDGDYVPLGSMIESNATGLDTIISTGANLSITCAEDIPFITEADVAKTSAGSFLGDSRVRAQQRACRIWDVHPVPAAFQQPVRSDAPIFMISGTDDPTTPPQYGRDALAYLPNGKQLLIAHATHDTEIACADALVVQFVRQRSVKGLKTGSCAAQSHRPPFATSMAGYGNAD